MDRHWLLTWTTYGTWLPGDQRSSVTTTIDSSGRPDPHNQPGEDYAPALPQLNHHIKRTLASPAVWLKPNQASEILSQILETARIRGWQPLAVAVMANHVHIVVVVRSDLPPEKLLGDFKAYATRRLNQKESRRWWTASGSTRKLPDLPAVKAAVNYVARQHACLACWVDSTFSKESGS